MADTLARSAAFRQFLDNGTAIADEIKEAANRIAEKMERIHGARYRVFIDHDVGLVSVREI